MNAHRPPSFRLVRLAIPCAVALALAAAAHPAPAHAQEGSEDVLRDFGSASTVEGEASAAAEAGRGFVVGRVFDAGAGSPLETVTVVLEGPDPGDGSEPPQQVQVSDVDGSFEFRSVAPGTYEITFIKSGYRNSTMTGFRVEAGRRNRADFPLPPLAAGDSDQVLLLDEFVVEAETAAEMMTSLETRLESDQLLNIMSAEDFSKFAAGDVGEALERVAGINIVEGQFAIIRGLEDRYSSTLYNGAPVPSPDPDRQSVQLDLFPSDVVGNLTVAKTFSPELPSNSSGGSIDIVTHVYPEDAFEFKLKAGTGYNDNAKERFIDLVDTTDVELVLGSLEALRQEILNPPPPGQEPEEGERLFGGNPIGRESEKSGSGNFWDELDDVLEEDYSISVGGTQEHGGRQFRFKGVVAREWDYSTAEGVQEPREPRLPAMSAQRRVFELFEDLDGDGTICLCFVIIPPQVTRSGDLSLGILGLTDGRFDFTVSDFERRTTAFGAFGFDLDDEGDHRIDASVFFSELEQDTIRFKENGTLPGFDYVTATQLQVINQALPNRPQAPLFVDTVTLGSFIGRSLRESANDGPTVGTLTYSAFFDSASFERDRSLKVYQINGDHTFDEIPGLHFSWATNWARTRQEDVSLGLEYFYEPCGTAEIPCPVGVSPLDPLDAHGLPVVDFPPSVADLGPGQYVFQNRITVSANQIRERSRFTRLDADYEVDFSEESTFTVAGGLWYERASRNVESFFVENPSVDVSADNPDCFGLTTQFACTSDTALGLGGVLTDSLGITGARRTSSRGERDIDAWYVRGKLSFWERLDLLGGVRKEKIFIESLNDPFITDLATGEQLLRIGGPQTFPTRFLFFDRIDNPFNGELGGNPPPGTVYNDQILGIDAIQPGPCVGDDGSIPGITCVDIVTREQLEPFVNGTIDEQRYLPSLGVALRPIEGLSLRGAWSKTVARPSFRELGYYATVEPGSDDVTVGNPQLQLSDVESWDARVEYTWGPFGDLLAASWFQKDIETPVESILIRDPTNASLFGGPVFRTFFNNPNPADLWGIEAEFRKSIDFFGDAGPDWLQYLSIGGNFTSIDAEVARSAEELRRAQPLFGVFPGNATMPADVAVFDELSPTRRLFNQPEWIGNADVTFDHPDWGTRITVAYFAISDVLDAAGSAQLSGIDVIGYTLDRYIDSYDEWRATFSQTFDLPGDFGNLTFKASVKNFTDSTRRVLYDPDQLVDDFVEREFKVGRDYDVSITYTRVF